MIHTRETAMRLLQECGQGNQNCHLCPLLDCGDNQSWQKKIINLVEKMVDKWQTEKPPDYPTNS